MSISIGEIGSGPSGSTKEEKEDGKFDSLNSISESASALPPSSASSGSASPTAVALPVIAANASDSNVSSPPSSDPSSPTPFGWSTQVILTTLLFLISVLGPFISFIWSLYNRNKSISKDPVIDYQIIQSSSCQLPYQNANSVPLILSSLQFIATIILIIIAYKTTNGTIMHIMKGFLALKKEKAQASVLFILITIPNVILLLFNNFTINLDCDPSHSSEWSLAFAKLVATLLIILVSFIDISSYSKFIHRLWLRLSLAINTILLFLVSFLSLLLVFRVAFFDPSIYANRNVATQSSDVNACYSMTAINSHLFISSCENTHPQSFTNQYLIPRNCSLSACSYSPIFNTTCYQWPFINAPDIPYQPSNGDPVIYYPDISNEIYIGQQENTKLKPICLIGQCSPNNLFGFRKESNGISNGFLSTIGYLGLNFYFTSGYYYSIQNSSILLMILVGIATAIAGYHSVRPMKRAIIKEKEANSVIPISSSSSSSSPLPSSSVRRSSFGLCHAWCGCCGHSSPLRWLSYYYFVTFFLSLPLLLQLVTFTGLATNPGLYQYRYGPSQENTIPIGANKIIDILDLYDDNLLKGDAYFKLIAERVFPLTVFLLVFLPIIILFRLGYLLFCAKYEGQYYSFQTEGAQQTGKQQQKTNKSQRKESLPL